jgi:hypothetical protein
MLPFPIIILGIIITTNRKWTVLLRDASQGGPGARGSVEVFLGV